MQVLNSLNVVIQLHHTENFSILLCILHITVRVVLSVVFQLFR